MVIYRDNKYMKMCSTLLVIKEMKIKTTLIHNFSPTRMTIIIKTITSVGEDVEKLEPSDASVKM